MSSEPKWGPETASQNRKKAVSAEPKRILVTGDPICDNNGYVGKRRTADAPERRGFFMKQMGGGSLLLSGLIAQAVADLKDWKTEFGLEVDPKTLPPEYHAYCLWQPQIANPGAEKREQFQVWRASVPALGYGHPNPPSAANGEGETAPSTHGPTLGRFKAPSSAPEIVVIDDAGLRFRQADSKECWPFGAAEQGTKPRWIVLKLTGSIGDSDLYREIRRCYRDDTTDNPDSKVTGKPIDNLIVIISADHIRRSDVRLSRGLSWEATLENLTAELETNPALKSLRDARHLIITFRLDAAFWRNNDGPASSSMLVFDAVNAEGDWEARQGEGASFGYMSCFTAAVVRALCSTDSKNDPDFEAALGAGLGAARELRVMGHGRADADAPEPGFPCGDIVKAITAPQPTQKFVSVQLPSSLPEDGKWMMLDEWHHYARLHSRQQSHREVARAVAVLGPAALERFPVARFGDLQTVDRNEIESLRTLRHLITAYQNGGSQKRPLSLGVFGPPGAGKSFGVTQIAMAVLGITEDDILTFNLSQFNDTGDLIGAFHRIRDRVLTGTTPLVFWDEFDSQGYRWLQYLLAPMQDGVFQQGQATHPIGKCVFVFAGATSPTFDTFGPPNPKELPELLNLPPEQQREAENNWLDFALKKGPDFKSRIVGFLNVLGPNPRQKCHMAGGRRVWTDDPTDVCSPIRRALFIRAQFRLKDGVRLEMDSGVLRALLETPRYKSGSRSLEFLCSHLRTQSAGFTPRRSHLPGHQLLDMHVDAKTFWEICERDNAFLAMSTELASALHEGFRLQIPGELLDVPYAALPPDKQIANRYQALRIPAILGMAKLQLVRGARIAAAELVVARQEEDTEVRQILAEPDMLNVLAEAEHNGWMVERMLAGIKYARNPDPARKETHDKLIPFVQLKEEDKDKDRQTIVGCSPPKGGTERFGYVDLVKIAGFRVVKITEPIAPNSCTS